MKRKTDDVLLARMLNLVRKASNEVRGTKYKLLTEEDIKKARKAERKNESY